jgi:hypothetical protein
MLQWNLAAVCGIYCGGCNYLDGKCKGCSSERGRVFWTKLDETYSNACPIWECCVERKELEHCGLCSDFPCSTYLDLKDPNDPQADMHKQQSIESLRHRTEVGTRRWLEEQEGLSGR